MDAPTDKYTTALRRFAGAGDVKMARSVVSSMDPTWARKAVRATHGP